MLTSQNEDLSNASLILLASRILEALEGTNLNNFEFNIPMDIVPDDAILEPPREIRGINNEDELVLIMKLTINHHCKHKINLW